MSMNHVKVELFPDPSEAPNFVKENEATPGKWKGVSLESVNIVKKGTVEGRPTVDLILKGDDGQLYCAMVTGRILDMIAAAVRGAEGRPYETN